MEREENGATNSLKTKRKQCKENKFKASTKKKKGKALRENELAVPKQSWAQSKLSPAEDCFHCLWSTHELYLKKKKNIGYIYFVWSRNIFFFLKEPCTMR